MNRDRQPADDLFRRIALDYWMEPPTRARAREYEAQHIPVNVYDTGEHVVIVAPMPGVEAENIDIQVTGNTVTLRASLRGPGQADREYLLHEWSYGPYERTITLHVDVDAQRANASHNNGVLVLSLPRADRSRAVRVPLRQVTSSQAEHRGHAGHDTGSDEVKGK